MTGRELIVGIKENGAEEMEVVFLGYDGIMGEIKPEIAENAEVKSGNHECGFLDNEGKCVIL